MAPRARRRHSVLGLTPMVELARQRGVDAARLLRVSKIPPALLDDPRAEVPFDREASFVLALLDRTRDPALGLEAGRHYHLALFGVLGAALRAAPTLREAIRVCLDHVDLTYTPFAAAFETNGAVGRLSFVDDVELGRARRFYLDRDIAFVLETLRELAPELHAPMTRRVDFDYPEPLEARRYREALPGKVGFGGPTARITFDLSLDVPRPNTSVLGLKLLEAELQSTFGVRMSDLAARIRREIAVAVALRSVRLSEDETAARLGLAPRTMRARLREVGASYRKLSDEVLARHAHRLLGDPRLSIREVAERLGFAEAASFIRAFRRWSGETPERARRRRQK